MNETSAPNRWIKEELPPNVCSICVKLITEYRSHGIKPPRHVACLYGHLLTDFPKNCIQPERTPYWMWTEPRPRREREESE